MHHVTGHSPRVTQAQRMQTKCESLGSVRISTSPSRSSRVPTVAATSSSNLGSASSPKRLHLVPLSIDTGSCAASSTAVPVAPVVNLRNMPPLMKTTSPASSRRCVPASPASSRRSVSPVTTVRPYSPVSSQRSGSPVATGRPCLPGSSRRSAPPVPTLSRDESPRSVRVEKAYSRPGSVRSLAIHAAPKRALSTSTEAPHSRRSLSPSTTTSTSPRDRSSPQQTPPRLPTQVKSMACSPHIIALATPRRPPSPQPWPPAPPRRSSKGLASPRVPMSPRDHSRPREAQPVRAPDGARHPSSACLPEIPAARSSSGALKRTQSASSPRSPRTPGTPWPPMCATTSKTRLAEDTSPALAKGLRGAREAVECCAGELAIVPPESVLETVGKHEKRHSLERMQLQANLLKLATELEHLSTSGKQGVEQDAVLAKLVAARSVSLTAVDLIRESRGMQKSASRVPRASPRRPPAVPVTTKKVVSRRPPSEVERSPRLLKRHPSVQSCKYADRCK